MGSLGRLKKYDAMCCASTPTRRMPSAFSFAPRQLQLMSRHRGGARRALGAVDSRPTTRPGTSIARSGTGFACAAVPCRAASRAAAHCCRCPWAPCALPLFPPTSCGATNWARCTRSWASIGRTTLPKPRRPWPCIRRLRRMTRRFLPRSGQCWSGSWPNSGCRRFRPPSGCGASKSISAACLLHVPRAAVPRRRPRSAISSRARAPATANTSPPPRRCSRAPPACPRARDGYAAIEYSALEGAWVVRTRHAHAWTRVWVDGRWIELDATPASWGIEEAEEAPFWQGVADLFRYGGYRWSQRGEFKAGDSWYAVLAALALFLGWRVLRGRRVLREEKAAAVARRRYPGEDSEFYSVEKSLPRATRARPTPHGSAHRSFPANAMQSARRCSCTTLPFRPGGASRPRSATACGNSPRFSPRATST